VTSTQLISHSRPSLGPEELEALAAVARSGQLAQGPRVAEFERAMAAWIGLSGGVAVSSGTAALHLALLAVGVGPGDEVLIPSYVCSALWLATVRIGAVARLVDIDLPTYALDPAQVKKAVTTRTRAIIVPHPFGLPADLAKLRKLRVPLIEDCAQTLGATQAGCAVGTVGQAVVCSFYATKLLCTGEGGMVLSNDQALLEKVRALRDYDEQSALNPMAFNHKMTDLQAALGLSQLSRLPSFLKRRSEIAEEYRAAFSQLPIELPTVPSDRTHVFYRYVVRLRGKGESRSHPRGMAALLDTLLAHLERRGLQCRRPVFRPLHRYLGEDGYPETERASDTALSVPIYPSLTDDDVHRVTRMLTEQLSEVLR
jgi:dTDP-4-amino-4,6-dideoxygalactose transaminase